MVVVYKDKTPEEEKRKEGAKFLITAAFIAPVLFFIFAYFYSILFHDDEINMDKVFCAIAIMHLVFAILMLCEYRKYGVVFKNLTLYIVYLLVSFVLIVLYLHFFLGWKLF